MTFSCMFIAGSFYSPNTYPSLVVILSWWEWGPSPVSPPGREVLGKTGRKKQLNSNNDNTDIGNNKNNNKNKIMNTYK
eukprot:6492089-Amphidinium_carterae.1